MFVIKKQPAEIKKGYCEGCPYDYGQEMTEYAYNMGCLPSTETIGFACHVTNKAWACHSEPEKVCCGYAARNKDNVDKKLLTVDGIHMRE